jgi:hypothetical protein
MVLPQADRRSAVPVGERRDLSRHWRNACTYGGHEPTAGKFHHVGNYLLTCTPPDHGQI